MELSVSGREGTGNLKLGPSQRYVGAGLEDPVGGTALGRSYTGLRPVFTFALSRSKSKHIWRQIIPLEYADATGYGESNMNQQNQREAASLNDKKQTQHSGPQSPAIVGLS